MICLSACFSWFCQSASSLDTGQVCGMFMSGSKKVAVHCHGFSSMLHLGSTTAECTALPESRLQREFGKSRDLDGSMRVRRSTILSRNSAYHMHESEWIQRACTAVPPCNVALCKPFRKLRRQHFCSNWDIVAELAFNIRVRFSELARILGASWHTTPASVSSNYNAERSALQSRGLLDALIFI